MNTPTQLSLREGSLVSRPSSSSLLKVDEIQAVSWRVSITRHSETLEPVPSAGIHLSTTYMMILH